MKIFIFLPIWTFIQLLATTHSNESTMEVSAATEINNAYATFLTTDHRGNLVMSWVEGDPHAESGMIAFAISPDKGKTFGKAIQLPATQGASTAHGECPPKIAFTKNGEIFIVYRVNQATDENPYGGNVYYIVSKDAGKTWTEPTSIANSHASSRGFFDVKRLADGNLGVVWLEGAGQHGNADHSGSHHPRKEGRGSLLQFARTNGNLTFSTPVTITPDACQCCKTTLYADIKGGVHVVYRAILEEGSRDIVHTLSTDGGKTFTSPRLVSADKWILDGCPHVGPDLTATAKGLHMVWFTKSGLYQASSLDAGNGFGPRKAIVEGKRASHPYITASPAGTLVTVWDETFVENEQSISKVGVQICTPAGKQTIQYLGDAYGASHPSVLAVDGETVFLTYAKETNKQSTVVYQRIALKGNEKASR